MQTLDALMDAALQAHHEGRFGEAERIYLQVIEEQPAHVEALHHLGLVRHQQGDSPAGLELIQKALVLEPANLRVRFNLIAVLEALGRAEEAEAAYLEGARQEGGSADDFCARANTALQQGQLLQAGHLWRMALALEPGRTEARLQRGRVLLERRKFAAALQAFEEVLQAEPGHPGALAKKGLALAEAGDLQGAMEWLRHVLALAPKNTEARLVLGDLLQGAERHEEAVTEYRAALQSNPQATLAHLQIANSLSALGRYGEAEAGYMAALPAHGHLATLHSNLGGALYYLGRLDEAERSCRRALEIDPDLAEAHANLGHVLLGRNAPDQAEACIRRALRGKPKHGTFCSDLGNALLRQIRVEEASEAYREALRLNPGDPIARSNLLFTMNYLPPGREALAEAHAAYGRALEPARAVPAGYHNLPQPERPLRVGFVSSSFRTHPVATFNEALFRFHDPAQNRFFCYSNTDWPDGKTAELRGLVEEWREIYGIPDEAAVAQIRADAIDLLVDLDGHTGRNCLPLFAHKPAPVQASYAGNMNTTGLTRMDYWITDAVMTPPELQPFYTETLYHLPRCLLAYTPPQDAPPVAPPPVLQNGFITFGSFNNPCKISPRVVETWTLLLKALPDARLMFRAVQFAYQPAWERVRGLFEAQGIARERLLVRLPSNERSTERRQYLEDFALVDIGLDTFPYNGVTTTDDKLWMGVPTVALAGDTSYSRGGLTLLTHLGHPEWVGASEEAYIAIAASLAQDREGLVRIREGLREEMRGSQLCDGVGLTRAMEAAFRDMWLRWCAGQG